MTTKLLPRLSTLAFAGLAALGRAFANSEARDGRCAVAWRDELAGRLQSEVASLDSLVHGFSRR